MCQLNAEENRIYNPEPLVGTLHSTEEQLDAELPFLQYLPNGHDPNQKWPVILFMHGIGEVGGTLRDNTAHSLPRVVESPEWDWPFIVLSPVLPTPSWVARTQLVSDILDYAVAELGGDPNRIYLTGLSHGGEGTVAIGIELHERVAALMPVTQGGQVGNWDMRANIVNTPMMAIIGTADSQYNNALGWAMDLEASGSDAFVHYDMPTADEHLDSIPLTALDESHVFVAYENIPHDVWFAAYGTYCDVLDAQKTVQYDWLLKQSLDGTPYVDPRDPNAMPGGGAGGAAGAAGAAGAGGDSAGGAAGSVAGGSGGTSAAGATGTVGGSAGAAGFGNDSVAGSTSSAGSPGGAVSNGNNGNADSSGGGCAVSPTHDTSLAWLLGLAAAAFGVSRRRRG